RFNGTELVFLTTASDQLWEQAVAQSHYPALPNCPFSVWRFSEFPPRALAGSTLSLSAVGERMLQGYARLYACGRFGWGEMTAAEQAAKNNLRQFLAQLRAQVKTPFHWTVADDPFAALPPDHRLLATRLCQVVSTFAGAELVNGRMQYTVDAEDVNFACRFL